MYPKWGKLGLWCITDEKIMHRKTCAVSIYIKINCNDSTEESWAAAEAPALKKWIQKVF